MYRADETFIISASTFGRDQGKRQSCNLLYKYGNPAYNSHAGNNIE